MTGRGHVIKNEECLFQTSYNNHAPACVCVRMCVFLCVVADVAAGLWMALWGKLERGGVR